MYKKIFITTLTLLSFAQLTLANDLAQDWVSMLKKADAYRIPAESVHLEIQVDQFKNNQLHGKKLYSVYTKPGRRSLVIFREAAQRGQKVLMVGDNFWILMPKSRRPIRITPMQKLMGEATIGDIATMTWSDDYQGVVVGKKMRPGGPVLHLKLNALTQGVSYKKIDLYLNEKDYSPVQADLYLTSGKLAKVAYFKMALRKGRKQVVEMILKDAIQKKRMTVVRYLDSEPKTLPAKFYNPAYLIRNGTGNLR